MSKIMEDMCKAYGEQVSAKMRADSAKKFAALYVEGKLSKEDAVHASGLAEDEFEKIAESLKH